jgi:hypothetical protein
MEHLMGRLQLVGMDLVGVIMMVMIMSMVVAVIVFLRHRELL